MHYKKYKSILSPKNGMNIYRGCSHGCIYCDARSKCYQMEHEFEDIEIKENAPEMLESELIRKRKKGMIFTGAMCDPYIHLEADLRYTRRCLEVIERYEFGVALLTKSNRVLRDIDVLCRINEKTKCVVQMTLTTYDEKLCRIIEPNVCTTKERFEALKILHENGIPTVVWFTPILPYINDTEENIRGILDYCIKAHVKGIISFGTGVTLREGDREYFYSKLDESFPGMKDKYVKQFGNAYEIPSPNSKKLLYIFNSECRKNHIMYNANDIFEYMNEFPQRKIPQQISLF